MLKLLLAEPNLSDCPTGVSTAVSSLACFDGKINVNLKIKSSYRILQYTECIRRSLCSLTSAVSNSNQ